MLLTFSPVRSLRSSYMGVCKVPVEGSLYRRIDMKSYRRSQVRYQYKGKERIREGEENDRRGRGE